MSTPIPQIKSPWRTLSLLLGFGFLYAPILILIIYSFNESRLVTVLVALLDQVVLRAVPG